MYSERYQNVKGSVSSLENFMPPGGKTDTKNVCHCPSATNHQEPTIVVYSSLQGTCTMNNSGASHSKRALERMHHSIWGYDFGEGLKKQGFAVDWLLSGSDN